MRAILLLTCALAACAEPIAAVRAPSPFAGQRDFIVEPVNFSGLAVGRKSEPEYLAAKRPEQVASWQADEAALSKLFVGNLIGATRTRGLQLVPAGAPPPSERFLIVRTSCSFIEPGFYAYITAVPTQAQVTVQILDPNGAVIEQVNLASLVEASMGAASSGERLRIAGADLGLQAARYLISRAGF